MDDQFTCGTTPRDFRRWEFLGRELEGALYARLPGTEPPVIVFGEDLTDLMYEIFRKTAIMESRSWPAKC
jgi:hypothetical protein